MSRTSRLIDRRLAKALVLLQACMIPVSALIGWVVKDSTSKQVLSNMYKGLMGKFAIVIVGFILILSNVEPLSAVALFCGFILVQAMSWVAPFWASRLQK